MRTLGIAAAVTGGRPTVRVVVLDDLGAGTTPPDLTAVELVDTFEVKSDQTDLATVLGEASRAVAGRVRSLQPDRVVVRRADLPSRPSNTEGPRKRLLVEGAVVGAVYDVLHEVVIRSGRDCGSACGKKKDELDGDAAFLVEPRYVEAAAAALSGFR